MSKLLKQQLLGLLAACVVLAAGVAMATVDDDSAKAEQQAQNAQAADEGAASPKQSPCTAKSAKPCPMSADKCPKSAPISKLSLPEADSSPFLTEENFVMNWAILGPFRFGENDFGGEHQQAAADKAFVEDEAGLTGAEAAPDGASWQTKAFTGNIQPGQVDLEALYDGIDHAATYAVACVESPKASEATIWTGADDYITVWVNGEQVLKYNEKRRGSDWDQDMAEHVKLKEGCNRIVVKITDVVGGYDFYFRLTDADGNPISVSPVDAPAKPAQPAAAEQPAEEMEEAPQE